MTLGEAIREGSDILREGGVEIPERTAMWLWMFVTSMAKHDVLINWHKPVNVSDYAAYMQFIKRRAHREPLQYITHETEFCGLHFYVDQRVLIPRPETEILVREALCELSRMTADSPTIVDIGTGSGAIIISIAHYLAQQQDLHRFRFFATDLSEDALTVAKINAKEHGVDSLIEFRQGSLLEALPQEVASIDLLVSNPPYIPASDKNLIQPEVVDYEPHLALFADDDGMAVYRELMRQSRPVLNKSALIVCEVGLLQSIQVADLMRSTWPDISVRMVRDAQAIERIVVGKMSSF